MTIMQHPYALPPGVTPEHHEAITDGPSETCAWDSAIPYASFHLAGDLEVEVGRYDRDTAVVVKIARGAIFGQPGRKDYLPLSKARARALASAIMGAAAEL